MHGIVTALCKLTSNLLLFSDSIIINDILFWLLFQFQLRVGKMMVLMCRGYASSWLVLWLKPLWKVDKKKRVHITVILKVGSRIWIFDCVPECRWCLLLLKIEHFDGNETLCAYILLKLQLVGVLVGLNSETNSCVRRCTWMPTPNTVSLNQSRTQMEWKNRNRQTPFIPSIVYTQSQI